MTKWYLALLLLLIFLIPANLFLKLDVSHAYVHGLLVDYLIPKLYASDLPIIGILGLWAVEIFKQKKAIPKFSKLSLVGSFILLLLLFRQFLTQNSEAAIWYFSKLIEFGAFAFFLSQHQAVLKNKLLSWVLLFTLLFQSAVGITQFYTQSSVFHNYLALGEVNYSHAIGLAKDNFFHTEQILPYGTTAHPNILGGFLTIGLLIILSQLQLTEVMKKRKASIALLICGGLVIGFALFLTQSLSAWGTLGIGLIILWQRRQFKFGLAVALFVGMGLASPIFVHYGAKLYPTNESFLRREMLTQAAFNMIKKNPLTGVGLNNFTVNLEQYANSSEIVRFVQPAHNIFILWFAETGLLGIVLLGLMMLITPFKKLALPILVLLPTALLDHYLLTQQTGLLIAVLLFTRFVSESRDKMTVNETVKKEETFKML